MIFNLLLAAVILGSLVLPEPGLWLGAYRRELVIAVMFAIAVTLPSDRLGRALRNARGLTAAGLVGYVVLPLACGLLGWLLHPDEPGLLAGLVVLGALPCTLTSATVWTRLAGGDDALALTYSIVSNLASIALIPLLLLVFLGEALPVPAQALFTSLLIVVLIPVAAGQLVRHLLGDRVDRWKPAVSIFARGMVLLVVVIAVAGMQDEVTTAPLTVLELAVVAALLHGLALGGGWWLAGRLGQARGQRIAIAFAGSQKTLFIGVFLAGEFFPDDPLALLPVTAYHVVQLVLDTIVAARLRRL